MTFALVWAFGFLGTVFLGVLVFFVFFGALGFESLADAVVLSATFLLLVPRAGRLGAFYEVLCSHYC